MPQTPATRARNGDSIPYVPGSAVNAGDVVLFAALAAIAVDPIAASALGDLFPSGSFKLPKDASVFSRGDRVFWNPTGSPVVGTASSGCATLTPTPWLVGTVAIPAATGDDMVEVRLLAPPHASLLFASVAASTAVTNTTTETAFDQSYTIPANALVAGDMIRIRGQVAVTSGNSTNTLTLKLKIGTTVIATTASFDVTDGGGDIGFFECDVVIRTAGASGTLVAFGNQCLGVPGTVTAKPFFLGSTAVDTTAAQLISVTATWSAASASNSCRLDGLTVERLRK